MNHSDNTSPPDGYRDVSVPIIEILQNAQILAVALLVIPIIIHIVLYGYTQFRRTTFTLEVLILAVPVVIVFIIVHEVVHALGWIIFGRISPKHIQFGFDRKTFSPYAHMTVPMNATAYRIGAALPGILTGIIPTCYGILENNGAITLLGAFMISAAVGDIYVLWVIRNVSANAIVLDHPSQAGCFVKIED